jgi:hypothetical protein
MSKANALAKGHYHWIFIRDRMIFNEVLPSEFVDGRQIIELAPQLRRMFKRTPLKTPGQ